MNCWTHCLLAGMSQSLSGSVYKAMSGGLLMFTGLGRWLQQGFESTSALQSSFDMHLSFQDGTVVSP